jgi:hypothetical protein
MLGFTAPRIRPLGMGRIGPARSRFALARTHTAKSTRSLATPDVPLCEHDARHRVEQDGDPIAVPIEKIAIDVDIEHIHTDAPCGRQRSYESERFVTQGAPAAGEERDAPHDAGAIFTGFMRPFTVIVLIALLVLLVGAFIIKMQSIGFTP